MNQLANQYPEVAPHVEALPPHIAEHVGSIALQLSHEDMHPKIEVADRYGATTLETDFSQVITDPEYDSSQLAEASVEAANAGKDALSRVLLDTSKLLHSSHDKLASEGFQFGAKQLETDEQRGDRERSERNTVYDGACRQAVEIALVAKGQGNNTEAIKALEPIILLQYMKSEQLAAEPDRKILRQAVHGGLAEELLQATQNSGPLLGDNGKQYVNRSMRGAANLLQLATGKTIGPDFETVSTEPYLQNILLDHETVKDVAAVITTKDSWLTSEKAGQTFGAHKVVGDIIAAMNPDAAADSKGSPDYTYDVVEASPDTASISVALQSVDPKLTLRAASELGLKPAVVLEHFGRSENWGEPKRLDAGDVEAFAELKLKHPEAYAYATRNQAVNFGNLYDHDGKKSYDVAAMSTAIDSLQAAGIDLLELSDTLIKQPNPQAFADSCRAVFAVGQASGLGPRQLSDLLSKSGQKLQDVCHDAVADPDKTHELVIKSITRAEIIDSYIESYRASDFPPSIEKPLLKPSLESMTMLKDRLAATGVSSDVASEMFEAWKSYSSMAITYRNKPPTVTPDDAKLEKLATDQSKAIMNQIEKLEAFTAAYGKDVTASVIGTFGIYNFSRYNQARLATQNAEWLAGTQIKTAVVNARADWNSYSKEGPVFDDITGEGVFYFEANSGLETARIAVKIGKHERNDNRREPDVQRFIIHAHGSPRGMEMGVKREKIDASENQVDGDTVAYTTPKKIEQTTINTEGYLNATKTGAKIGAREINDYRKHLGENWMLILQSCSTAGVVPVGEKNIAETMSERHNVATKASPVTIHSLTIRKDGNVTYGVNPGSGNGEAMSYGS